MDINFQNFSKLIASFENKDISALLNNCEVKNFNEVIIHLIKTYLQKKDLLIVFLMPQMKMMRRQ